MLANKILTVEIVKSTPNKKKRFLIGYYDTVKGFHDENLKEKRFCSTDLELEFGKTYLLEITTWSFEGREGFQITKIIQEYYQKN